MRCRNCHTEMRDTDTHCPGCHASVARATATAPSRPPGSLSSGHRRLGRAIPAVVLGLLSWVVGLWMLSSSKTGAPADGKGPATNKAPAEASGRVASPKTGTPAGWSAVIAALQVGTPSDGKGPATSKTLEQLAQAWDTRTAPKPDPKHDPEPEPLPLESIRFAGRRAGDQWSANGVRMTFCWCPPGTFTMGSPRDEKEREPAYCQFSEDQVAVKLTKGFWLAKYETTQGQWERVMGTTLREQFKKANDQLYLDYINSRTGVPWSAWAQSSGEGPSYPIYYVNHAEATAFCQRLTEQERQAGRLPRGWEYRLPTDAQWEYACRAGTRTATAFGDQLSSREANFDGNYPYNGAEKGPRLGRLAEVGQYRPNAWGLCDLHGNVREWCRDCYQAKLPGGTDPEVTTNPVRTTGEADKVVRGGSWQTWGSDCRSARRFGSAPVNRDNGCGFRVAAVLLTPKPKPAPPPDPNPSPEGTLLNSIGMKLAPIPAGKFLMGSPRDEPGRPQSGLGVLDYEEQHEVTIREPFYLGIYLVTQEQYQYIMGDSPRYFPSYFSREGVEKEAVKEFKDTRWFPVECVTWNAAQEFCRKLSALPAEKAQGRRYRLPTEAEWEYACRGGAAGSTRYYFGNTINANQANFGNNVGRTTPVGYYANPNPFGLYDMHGNLWEWCEDFFGPYQKDPGNPKPGTSRVMRGGSFVNYGYDCRSASRSAGSCDYGHCTIGFRVALSVGARTPKPEERTLEPNPLPKDTPGDSTGMKPIPIPPTKVLGSPRDEPERSSVGRDEKKDGSNPEVAAALTYLKSKDKLIRQAGAEQLAASKPDANREKVAKALEERMTDPDIFVLGAVTRALKVWGGKENVPGLVKVTTDKNIFHRGHAMDVLAALKDARGAEAVAKRLSDVFDRGKASASLKAMGSVAETAVLKRLNSDIKEVRIEVCKILQEIGTQKCVRALEKAARDEDADVAKEAQEALAKVKP